MADLPTGTLTFLFTDIEGSTRLWEAQRDAMRDALARHDALVRTAIARHAGQVFKTGGDAFCAVFITPADALAAALAAQRALRAERWPEAVPLAVRMAVHTGVAERRDADYFGEPLNRVARLLESGHDLGRDHLPPQAALKSLGEHGLRDLARREQIFQLVHPELQQAFPPLRSRHPPAAADLPSIAVLPFVNLSPDAENEYFADGLAEELLNMLSKIRGLRVASRTSAFWFKGKDADLATVAQKLNVATVLEGSMRKAGNRVRITAQLIQVATDSHLWSETYDRELTDIFAMQDDIARTVVTQLRSALLGEAPTAASAASTAAEVAELGQARGVNPEAYRFYLEGKFLIGRRVSNEIERAIDLLHQALELQPDHALAWVELASAHRANAEFGGAAVVPSYALAHEAVERALALAPNLVEAHIELAAIRTSDWDWHGAEAALTQALALAPDNPNALVAAGFLARIRGRIPEAIALGERAVALDPLNVDGHTWLAASYVMNGRLDDAAAAVRVALSIAPSTGGLRGRLGRVRLMQGRHDEALKWIQEEPLEYMRLYGTALVQHAAHRPAESDAALQKLLERNADNCAAQIAFIYAFRGEADAAFAWLERAYAQRDHGLHGIRDPYTMGQLHADPRWPLFLERLGLAD
jgi:TolB-like protein/class 3 adenylate cyclase/Flp pilus assembly protein TadD